MRAACSAVSSPDAGCMPGVCSPASLNAGILQPGHSSRMQRHEVNGEQDDTVVGAARDAGMEPASSTTCSINVLVYWVQAAHSYLSDGPVDEVRRETPRVRLPGEGKGARRKVEEGNDAFVHQQ